MEKQNPDVPNKHVVSRQNDDLNIYDYFFLVWHDRWLVLFVCMLFLFGGLVYSIIARQVWTSQAIISEPSVTQVNLLQLNIDKLKNNNSSKSENDMDFSSLQRQALYQSFVSAFNSMNNKRAFLTAEGIFSEELNRLGRTDHSGERALMSKLGEGIVAKNLDKTSTDVILSFSAESAELAQQRLTKYIDYIQKKQIAEKNAELSSLWQNRIKTLTSQYESIRSDTLQTRNDNIRRTQYSLRISQAAGVERPLERMSNEDVFNIELGSKGLAEKLSILKEIKDPEVLNNDLGRIRLLLHSLKSLQLNDVPFNSFNMIDSPEEPFTRDKPKRLLIVSLATFFGGMLGIVIALVRHALHRVNRYNC